MSSIMPKRLAKKKLRKAAILDSDLVREYLATWRQLKKDVNNQKSRSPETWLLGEVGAGMRRERVADLEQRIEELIGIRA